ncbi:MAG TPA: L-threonylcarbamoyladenylate synthase [Oscillospiraceae bacterium]|nr:L-threonylcarbamoyladenylate synthase [Oscillospiraceae bacterium]HPF56468.1 L-threonylcarbamoyladenylate synthase [Clostridiales bacterium]HPK36469.1 L-threonylcarbamoyladenylate synthase [Oscillospiraceae bacterium]HPR75767.1 L-threonylcarbamoyladenylate synthase [Oscillospiraceae bacterium]
MRQDKTKRVKFAEKMLDRIARNKKYKTQIVPADDDGIAKAEKLLSSGQVVAVATETVYGLAASAFHDGAVKKIFIAKGRPQNNPLIVHITTLNMVYPLVTEIPAKLKKLAETFWPGPLTIVMKKSGLIPPVVTGGLDTVAIRMPSHPSIRKLIDACGYPLAAPSANSSGMPSPTTAQHVFDDLNGKIPLILDGGTCEVGVESTVISLAGEKPILLRPGAITLEQLQAVLGEVEVAKGVDEAPSEDDAPLSPGMSYRHYSPKAKVTLVVGSEDAYLNYLSEHNGENVWALCFGHEGEKSGLPYLSLGEFEDSVSAQHNLFAALRMADEKGAAQVIARCPKKNGEWYALFNRLQRSAGFTVIEI